MGGQEKRERAPHGFAAPAEVWRRGGDSKGAPAARTQRVGRRETSASWKKRRRCAGGHGVVAGACLALRVGRARSSCSRVGQKTSTTGKERQGTLCVARTGRWAGHLSNCS